MRGERGLTSGEATGVRAAGRGTVVREEVIPGPGTGED